MIKEVMHLRYSDDQRKRFRAGDLLHEWHEKYRNIFDDDDLRIALTQAKDGYHFFEWLGAIVLYETLGLLSLVEQYEFKNHLVSQTVLSRLVSADVRHLICDHEQEFGHVQCPDLLVYAPDFSYWFFCEVKGNSDQLRENQIRFFEALSEVSKKPIYTVRFTAFKNCN